MLGIAYKLHFFPPPLLILILALLNMHFFMNSEQFLRISIVCATNRNNEIEVSSFFFSTFVFYSKNKCWFGLIYQDVSDILNQKNATLRKYWCQRVSLPSLYVISYLLLSLHCAHSRKFIYINTFAQGTHFLCTVCLYIV